MHAETPFKCIDTPLRPAAVLQEVLLSESESLNSPHGVPVHAGELIVQVSFCIELTHVQVTHFDRFASGRSAQCLRQQH